MFKWGVLVLLCLFVSCVPVHEDNRFVSLKGDPFFIHFDKESGFLITASFDGAFFDDIIRLLPDGISVCCDDKVRFSRFTLDVNNVDVETFLYACCRSASCSLERFGDLYVFSTRKGDGVSSGSGSSVIGKEGKEVAGSFGGGYSIYLRFPYYKKDEVVQSVSQCGCSSQYLNGDRYIVTGDIGSIVKVRQMHKVMLSGLPCEYAFDLWVVSKDYLVDADVGLSVNGSGGYNLKKMAGEVVSYQWEYLINVLSSANLERTSSDYVRHVSGVFREKSNYKVTVGDSIPYVKRALTDSGASVDTGVEYTDVGFSLDIGVEGASAGVCRLSLNFTDVGGYVQGYPVKHGSTLVDEFVVSGDNRRFVGSFLIDGFSRSLIGFSRKRSEWLVFLRVIRVSAGQYVEYQ